MPGLVEMHIESVRVHMLSNRHVVILKDQVGDRYLPIWIGAWEASAIAMRLQGLQAERPLTHDLFAAALERLGVRVQRVVISELADETYHARIHLERDGDPGRGRRPAVRRPGPRRPGRGPDLRFRGRARPGGARRRSRRGCGRGGRRGRRGLERRRGGGAASPPRPPHRERRGRGRRPTRGSTCSGTSSTRWKSIQRGRRRAAASGGRRAVLASQARRWAALGAARRPGRLGRRPGSGCLGRGPAGRRPQPQAQRPEVLDRAEDHGRLGAGRAEPAVRG